MSFENMKGAAQYQAFVRNPNYPILQQVADEIKNSHELQLKSEKTTFGTARNLIRYEVVNEVFKEFFNTLENRANGKG